MSNLTKADTFQSKLDWHHTMTYVDFLNAVIEHELRRMQKWSKLDKTVFEHGCRALINCKHRDYKTINSFWHDAVKRYMDRKKNRGSWSRSWMTALDLYHVNTGFVLQCLSVAYGVKRKEGFIQPQAVDLTHKILNITQ